MVASLGEPGDAGRSGGGAVRTATSCAADSSLVARRTAGVPDPSREAALAPSARGGEPSYPLRDYPGTPFEKIVWASDSRHLWVQSFERTRNCLLRLDTVGRRAYHDKRPLELSPRELAVLELLLMRAGRVVSKEQLVNHLYGWGDEVADNAIEVNVYRLRKKLEPLGCEIRTVRGMGYLMDSEFYGTPYYIDRIEKELATITLDDVNAAIRKYLSADNIKIAVVVDAGKGSEFFEAMANNVPTPMTYESPKPEKTVNDDKEIAVFPLKINRAKSRVVDSKDLFEKR